MQSRVEHRKIVARTLRVRACRHTECAGYYGGYDRGFTLLELAKGFRHFERIQEVITGSFVPRAWRQEAAAATTPSANSQKTLSFRPPSLPRGAPGGAPSNTTNQLPSLALRAAFSPGGKS